MDCEEFIVRITPKGEIVVECDGLAPRRVKDLAEALAETVGPTRIERSEDPGASGQVHLETDLAGREEEDDRDRPRLRTES